MISRIISLLVAGGYTIFAYSGGGGSAALKCGLFCLLPLACIWFSEEMGDFTGTIRGHAITTESPGSLVAFFGWVLLLLPVAAMLYWSYSTGN